jgi:hypothetical protein
LQYWTKYHGRISGLAYRAVNACHELLRILGYAAVYAIRPAARGEAAYKIKRGWALLSWLVGDQITGSHRAEPKHSVEPAAS